MPTYEYACRACGHEFEQFQSITADPVRTCPRCGKRKVERKIGIGAGVLFRGGGFYETDYRSDSYSKAEKAERESGSKAGAGSGDAKATDAKASGDTKTATDAKAKGDASAAGPAAPAKESSSGTGTSKPEAPAKADGGSKPRKSHAREGRGIGNILALGRGATTGSKGFGSAKGLKQGRPVSRPQSRGKRR
jgi:putative FmdB family regulatory protein